MPKGLHCLCFELQTFMMVSRIPMESLLKYASIGGVACFVIGSAYQVQITMKVKNAQYFKEAMGLLNEHQAADLLLGKPINAGYIDVFSKKNHTDSKSADLYVPLKGSKAKGELFLTAVKPEDSWLIKRIELEMKDNLGGKVLIFGDVDKEIS